jgi:methyltransferase (TIGR00027 family)
VADEQVIPGPDQTAVRVALWRALHLEVDAEPPVLADAVGLLLADPADGWRQRPDMDPAFTRGFRAAIVARARFIEDLVTAAADSGIGQYVLLGAGLDTFVQRRAEYAGRLRVFEVDQPAAQAWKRQRLANLGYGVPEWLRLVPVDFEAGASWWDLLARGDDLPASGRAARRAGPAASGDGGERRTGLGHAVHQLLLPR